MELWTPHTLCVVRKSSPEGLEKVVAVGGKGVGERNEVDFSLFRNCSFRNSERCVAEIRTGFADYITFILYFYT